MLVVICSMPMLIWNRFWEKLANGSKITTFMWVLLFAALVTLVLRFP